MKIFWISLISVLLVTPCFAVGFLSARDLSSQIHSNIKLKNSGSTSKTVYGLYVRQYSYVLPNQPCSSATIMYPSSNNVTAGGMVMPVEIAANGEASVGANYLYNMLNQANYYIRINVAGPPGCALPGCTWGSDSTIYNWCIYLGAIAPTSVTASYTSTVPPHSSNVSARLYSFDLASSYNYIGPISCNDLTLTCSAETTQTQSF